MAETRLSTSSDELAGGADVRCQLVVIEGPEMGRAVLLDAERSVGSGPKADLRLSDDTVSERHLTIKPQGQGFLVKDEGSTNGTFFEGSRVTQLELKAGATLKVGKSYLRLQPQQRALEVTPSQARRFGELVAESFSMREVFAVLELAAASEVTVLVQGETGTGKELVARAIHEASARRGKPFVAIDCGALPESLLESELFGHVRGAFTGADRPRVGHLETADGGTLFLDEIGELPSATQIKLLRFLQEREFSPVGSAETRKVDVRVVAATNRDLTTAVKSGAFREDFFYRLNVLGLTVPPLRERREDIGALIDSFLDARGLPADKVTAPSRRRLEELPWPGNVRELFNTLERALLLAGDEPVGPGWLEPAPPSRSGQSADSLLVEGFNLDALERDLVAAALARAGGNKSAAARLLGVTRRRLYSRLATLSVPEEDEP